MQFKDIDSVLHYIENKKNFQLGLLRVEDFLKEAKIKFNDLKFIHVGGTNGKGSVSYYLSNILIEQGYKTGFFSSPSIQGHNDRIRINNQFISDQEIIDFVNQYYDLIEKTEVTMFEIDVLMALAYFDKNKVDYAVIEVGMGGRYDGTNVINPLVSVITNIGLDHMDYLGKNKAEIAYTKAGIIKENGIVVTSEKEVEALDVIKDYAKLMQATVIETKQAKITNKLPITFDYLNYQNIQLKTLALYQVSNACTVLEVVEVLKNKYQIKIDQEVVKNVFANVTWPGRFEVMQQQPLVIIDGAHNLEGVKALTSSLETFKDHKITILFSALADKDTKHMLELLNASSEELVVTHFDFYRAASLEQLDPDNLYQHVDDYESYLKTKIESMQEDEMLIITGSLYFITKIRNLLLNTLK